MAPRKKHEDSFDEMRAKAESIMNVMADEGQTVKQSAANFRKFVIAWLTLQMKMIVWLYQYVRAAQAAQKEMDDEAMLDGAHEIRAAAIAAGPKAIPLGAGKPLAAPVVVPDNGNPNRTTKPADGVSAGR